MGANFSSDITPPPLTLRDCIIDGRVNISRYYYYRRRLDAINKSNSYLQRTRKTKRKFRLHLNTDSQHKRQRRQHQSVKNHNLYVRGEDGSIREVTPEDTHHLFSLCL